MSQNNNASTQSKGGKKKGAKFQPLPAIQAAEEKLQWHVEVNNRHGRHAVATEDIPAGTLLYAEHPFITVPISKFSHLVCHKCTRPIPQSKDAPATPPGNPCLPRYCPTCKESPHELDAKLAPLRIKLPEISTKHSLDPIMLNLLIMFDLQRSGIDIGVPSTKHTHANIHGIDTIPTIQCSIADYDLLANVWDRRPESWRQKVGPAVRQLHKELVALSESKAIPNYTPSPIARLQADAAQLSIYIHGVSAPYQQTETCVGIFPGLSAFQHSCAPNAFFLTDGDIVFVRTILNIPKGTPITISYVGVTEPRSRRKAALENERYISCSCSRCEEPIDKSADRFLEGVFCLACRRDVMLPYQPGSAENEEARKEFIDRLTKQIELEKNAALKRAAKAGKGGKKGKGAASGGNSKNAEEKKEEQATGDNENKDNDEDKNATENNAQDEKPQQKTLAQLYDDELVKLTNIPEGTLFWHCCACDNIELAHNVNNSGPGDVVADANQSIQQALYMMRMPDLHQQAEKLLEHVAGGVDGRLSPYHARIMDALAPLINLNTKKGESVKVLTYAIQLWDIERSIVEERVTLQQLSCLEAIIDAANSKAKDSSSSVIKQQFEKKVKAATSHLKETKRILLGAA